MRKTANSEERIVHVLRAGLPLCGFSRDVPAAWPDGHLWVGINCEDFSDVNCSGCVKELKSETGL